MLDDPQNDTVLTTMAFAAVDDLLILCHSEDNPSEAEWDRWIATERLRKHRALLVLTRGGSPNSRQRARVAELLGATAGPTPPVALLTDSTVLRTLMTAFTWLLGRQHRMKAFSPEAVEDAVAWTAVEIRPERVRITIRRLQAALTGARAQRGTPR
jgi:hypothetical protein